MTSGSLLLSALLVGAPPQPCPDCDASGADPSRGEDPESPADPAVPPPDASARDTEHGAEPSPEGPDAEDPKPDAADTTAPDAPIDATMFGESGKAPPQTTPARPRTTSNSPRSAADLDDALRRELAAEYRPPSNPAKLHVAARALYYAGSSRDGRSYVRAAGVTADVGVSWNYIGVAATMTALPGNTTQYTGGRNGADGSGIGLYGGGLTLNLGRLALVGRGVLALNFGYDVYAQPVRSTTIEPDFTILRSTQLLVPHGPRIGLDLGLQTLGQAGARFHHAIGMHMGWQLLISDLRAGSRSGNEQNVSFSPTNALMIGLSYWMG